MITAKVIKSFRDIESKKTYIKESIYTSDNLLRIKNLEDTGFINVISKSDDFLTFKELKEKHPTIKAKSKKEFLNKIKK